MLRTALGGLILLLFSASQPAKAADTLNRADAYNIQLQKLIKTAKRVQNNTDSLKIVIGDFRRLHDIYKNKKTLIYICLYEANYEWLNGNHVKSIRLAETALSLARQQQVTQPLPVIYAIIGNLHKENTNFPKAFEAAEKGLKAARLNQDTSEIIALLGVKAMFQKSYVKHFRLPIAQDSSIYLQFEGLRLADANPERFKRLRIRFYDNIALYYKDAHQYDKAIFYAKKGIALATELNEKRSLTYGYNWLGEALHFKGQQEAGMIYLKKALAISQELKQPYRTMELYEAIAHCYQRSSNFEAAWAYMKKYQHMRDSLNVQTNEKQIEELEIKYKTAEKDKQLAIANQAEQNKTILLKWAMGGIVIFLLLLVILVYLYGIIRKNYKKLQDQNKQINEQANKMQTLMQELHHRVKNNLQIVSGLLTLQSNRMEDNDARNAIDVSRQRIEAMSIIHSSLYQYDNVNKVNINDFTGRLLVNMLESFGMDDEQVNTKVEIDIEEIDVDIAMPLGLIMNEWITNIFKHAYKGSSAQPSINVGITHTNKNITVDITDNGIGFPAPIWDNPKGSFGIKLIKILVKQINGTINISQGSGTIFNLEIPFINAAGHTKR